MWDGPQERITVERNKTVLDPLDALLIRPAPYSADPEQQELEREEFAHIEKADAAGSAITEWASPIVFVPKNNVTLRFCIDYRQLNNVTVRDSYRIPRMHECIDSLVEATLSFTIGASSRY